VISQEGMDLSSVVLAMAQAEGPASVLGQVVGALARHDEVALARVWFLDDDSCPVCRGAPAGALHLRASGGRPGAPEAWWRTDGACHLVGPGSASRIARVASGDEPMVVTTLDETESLGIETDLLGTAAVRGFVGFSLRFRGRVVGVLACYLHDSPSEQVQSWLPTFAAHAAVAIGNCRAFQEIKRLHDRLELERDYLREENEQAAAFDEIVGSSEALQRLLRQVEMVAPTDANVVIQGESGTGKELIARAIHRRSPRASRSLVKVNCGSIPKELFESEFFGHARGAFTGAVRDRVGRFQLADRGTLFLDEVGEIPLELQAKLLRVLQEGEFERVGEDTTRHVSVRVLAATNRDLRTEVDAGRFRLDLYYRLNVFLMQVPALRDRREDIGALAALFVRRACARLQRDAPRVPQREIDSLLSYEWPGNVRELQHEVERAVILAAGGTLRFDLGARARSAAAPSMLPSPGYRTEKEWRRLERDNLIAALAAADGKVSGPGGAAALLGVNANTLASRLRALGLRKRYAGTGKSPSTGV
jgi:transcriptional regulator with GAF, ATPase, and Fis domain